MVLNDYFGLLSLRWPTSFLGGLRLEHHGSCAQIVSTSDITRGKAVLCPHPLTVIIKLILDRSYIISATIKAAIV